MKKSMLLYIVKMGMLVCGVIFLVIIDDSLLFFLLITSTTSIYELFSSLSSGQPVCGLWCEYALRVGGV
jgi:hypothetical protein